MRRIVIAFGLCIGGMVASVTSASAAYYCNADPYLGIGTPVNYSLTTHLSIGSFSLDTQNDGGSRYQHFAAGFGI